MPTKIAQSGDNPRRTSSTSTKASIAERRLVLATMREILVLLLAIFAVFASFYVAMRKIPDPRVEPPFVSAGGERMLSRLLVARYLELPATRARRTVTAAELGSFLEPFVRQGLVGRDSAREAIGVVMNGLREIGVDAAHQLLEWWLRERAPPGASEAGAAFQSAPVTLTCAPRLEFTSPPVAPPRRPRRPRARPRLCQGRAASSESAEIAPMPS